jgi:hypothetical protein
MVRSAFLPSFGVPAVTAAVPAASLSCKNAEKNAKIHAEYGVIRGIPDKEKRGEAGGLE